MADLSAIRSGFSREYGDPRVRDSLFALTHAEVGGQGPQAQQAFIESVFNRAAARKRSLYDTINDRKYFPPVTFSRMSAGVPDNMRDHYGGLFQNVVGGSNISNLATGNASGTVGFAGGPQTFAANGERFGIEGPDRGWASIIQARQPAGAPMEYQWHDALPPEEAAFRMRQATALGGPVNSQQVPQQGQQPGLLDQIVGRAQNPLFQQGLGMFLAASQGKDLNEGLNAGNARAKAMQDVMMRNLALQKQQEQAAQIKKMMSNPAIMGQVPPALIEIARATGDPSPIVQHIVKSQASGQTSDIKEYEYAKARGFTGSLQDWLVNKRASSGEYAKQLVYGEDANGNVVPLQAGSRGDIKASIMPEGVKLRRDPIKIDAGDRYILLDPTTRQPIGQVMKNIAEAKRQEISGEAKGKAEVALPLAESNAANLLNYIDSVANDPYLDNMIGPVAGRTPNFTTQARTLQSKIDQLNNQGFLIAFENLKGAGAITETEGAAATKALTRMKEMVQSGGDYRAALKDFRNEVIRLRAVARQKAGVPVDGQPQASAPKRLKWNPSTGDAE